LAVKSIRESLLGLDDWSRCLEERSTGPAESSRTASRTGEDQTGLGEPRARELVGEPHAVDDQVSTERLGDLAATGGNCPENSKVSVAQWGGGGGVHRFSFHFSITDP
jgi:hypothetical protein